MRFLPRRSTDSHSEAATASGSGADSVIESSGGADPSGPGVGSRTPGKGRPTPKRRDAEGRRRGPAPPPPRTQRESQRLAKQNRANRKERREARAAARGRMLAGDERALPPREKGPVKAYMRDVIDSRRHLTGLFMPLAGIILVSLLAPNPAVQNLLTMFSMALIISMFIEAVLLGRQVTVKTRRRFPKETVGAVSTTFYVFTRASQLRRLRVPKPRVSYGAEV